MNAFHLDLLQWLAAGTRPTPWLLTIAVGLALGGPWLSTAVIGTAAWRRPGHRAYILFVLAGAAITAMLCQEIAARINVPRPFITGLVPAYIPHGASASLPSTHASVMFMVAFAFLARPVLRAPGIALFAVAAATGWARIHVGVHFPLDIAVGLLFGAVMAGLLGAAWWMLELGAQQLALRMPGLAGKRWPAMPRPRA